MFFMKFFQFCKGYVILSLEGYAIERFINICMRRGIKLLAIEKHDRTCARAAVYISDFNRLRPIAYKTKTKVKIQARRGLPHLISKYKHRYVLLAGAAICIVLLAVSSQFIWFVEYEGVENADINQLRQAVQRAGVVVGAAKRNLPPGDEIKSTIINGTNGISWAWVYIKGTKAVVEVKESIRAPHMIDMEKPCDIVAMRDAVIKSVTAKNGSAYVHRGDAVLEGDVLIAGTLDSAFSNFRLCHALGTVEAYTYHRQSGEYKLYHEVRSLTGKKKTHVTLHLFGKDFALFTDSAAPYTDYDVATEDSQLCIGKDYYLGLGLSTVTYHEVAVSREPISYDAAVQTAKAELEEKIAKELIAGADLQKQELVHEQLDAETIRVTLSMDFIEKIGTEREIVIPSP